MTVQTTQQIIGKNSPVATVLRGDAFELIETLEENVDLILTSPPYWGQRTYGLAHNWDILNAWKEECKTSDVAKLPVPTYEWYKSNGGVLGLEPLPDWYIQHLVEFFERARTSLRPTGSIWVNLGDTYFTRWSSIRDKGRQGLGENPRLRRRTPMGGYLQEKSLLLIPSRFAIAMQEKKWILRNDLIWFKPNIPPRPEKDRLRLSHEHFFHFVKKPTNGRAKYYYDPDASESGSYDVVQCSVTRGENGHSATFPTAIIAPRILSSSPPGGTVVDPFCGTGRALKVAADLGRRGIGFELSDNFASTRI